MWGDGGDDTMWGQDGNDAMHGGDNNDDMYGELGNDTMFGDAGNDAMLGDRGGVVDELMNPSDIAKQFIDSTNNPPKETYTGFRQGTLDHRVDLLHDIDGDVFVGTSSSAAMPHPGLTEGGNDRIRGGTRPGQHPRRLRRRPHQRRQRRRRPVRRRRGRHHVGWPGLRRRARRQHAGLPR